MSKEMIEKQAYEYFKSGYFCSEAVYKTITENYAETSDASLSRLATGFLGGMGGSHKETCGALTGGIIALGLMYGRTRPDEEIPLLKNLIIKFRDRFVIEFGSATCEKLLDIFGEQVNNEKCFQLAARTAGILAEIIDANN